MLLAIDTATRYMSLALHTGRQLTFEHTWYTPNNHTIELTPAIRSALHMSQLSARDLTAVAVAQGPGSFTGLRIGLGVAKGLVAAQNIPLIAIPTLDITAAQLTPTVPQLIAVLPAGRTRICVQHYNWDHGQWNAVGTAEITTWENLIAQVEHPTLIGGEIDDRGHDLLASADRPVHVASGAHNLRRAGMLAELAWERLRANRVNDPATTTPIYLHQPGVPHP